MFRGTSKFEINLSSSNLTDVASTSTFAIKNRVPSLVVNPAVFAMAVADKSMKMARYKLIVSIDFENQGKRYALDKIRDLPHEILGADGFDILLTPGRSEIETLNEMKGIEAFLKQSNTLAEIRWVVDRRWGEEDKKKIIKCMKKVPIAYVRTDSSLTTKTSLKDHKADVEMIREEVPYSIKLSGNITYDVFKEMEGNVSLFDVTMAQASAIVKEATADMTKARQADE